MLKHLSFLIIGASLIVSCSNSTQTKEEEKVFDPSILDDKILGPNGILDPVMADSAVKLYMKSYRMAKKDSIAPYQLMKAADIQRNVPGKALMAIKKYYTIKEEFPNHILAPAAFFMMGLTFDENLNDKERSAKVYAEFLNIYPEHDLASQAKDLLALSSDSTSNELDQVHKWLNK